MLPIVSLVSFGSIRDLIISFESRSRVCGNFQLGFQVRYKFFCYNNFLSVLNLLFFINQLYCVVELIDLSD